MAYRCWEIGQMGGCLTCRPDGEAIWTAKNAQAVAAKHYYATGHKTWAEAIKHVEYGNKETLDDDAKKRPTECRNSE